MYHFKTKPIPEAITMPPNQRLKEDDIAIWVRLPDNKKDLTERETEFPKLCQREEKMH